MNEPSSDRLDKAKARGRRAGILVYATIVAAFTIASAGQIIYEVWFAPVPEETGLDCSRGALDLIAAVRRAREAAASETGGEHRALERFRAELEPEWSHRRALGVQCRSNSAVLRALKEIDRLRYAEEHAVRYEAVDLARRRQRVLALESKLTTERGSTEPAKENP